MLGTPFDYARNSSPITKSFDDDLWISFLCGGAIDNVVPFFCSRIDPDERVILSFSFLLDGYFTSRCCKFCAALIFVASRPATFCLDTTVDYASGLI